MTDNQKRILEMVADKKITVDEAYRLLSLVQPSGILADVAPTILNIMGVKKPDDMTGTSLI